MIMTLWITSKRERGWGDGCLKLLRQGAIHERLGERNPLILDHLCVHRLRLGPLQDITLQQHLDGRSASELHREALASHDRGELLQALRGEVRAQMCE